MGRSGRVILAASILVLFAAIGIVTGCCDECKPTKTEPISPLVGKWECVRYEMNGTDQPQLLGLVMTLENGGTGYNSMGDTSAADSFSWASLDSVLFLEVQGMSTGLNYTISNDSLFTGANILMIYSVEIDWIRFKP